MLSSVDPIGKIQQIYREGERPVPYPIFMSVFNELLIDEVEVEPKKPSEELKEKFRAVCMAVHAGVADPLDRGDQRIEEFYEKIHPVWKDALASEEFQKYDHILAGKMRQKFQGKAGSEEEQEVQAAPAGSEKLFEKLGLAEGAEAAAEEAAPAPGVSRFDTMGELVAAAKEGEPPIDFAPRGAERVWARYAIEDHEVEIRLARAEEKLYVVLRTDVGYDAIPEAEVRVTDYAAAMGYVRAIGLTYLRQDDDLVCTLKVAQDSLSIASGLPADSSDEDVLVQLQRSHRELGELVENLGG